MTNLNDHGDVQEGYSKSGKKLGMYIYVLPNLMTTANLFCGFFSIVQSIQGDFKLAAYAVVAAAISRTLRTLPPPAGPEIVSA